MTFPPITSSIDEGIDRKQLNNIKKRFLDVCETRLQRTKASLNSRQQLFLDLLPLLFHVTHPMLPGYVSHDTPSGVIDYLPTRNDISLAQKIARSFTLPRDPAAVRHIQALFLMGSSGSIAHSDKSDLDIWVCHNDHLDETQLSRLKTRCEKLSQWAKELGLEAHFFLMSPQSFRSGERENLSTEDCGSAQHYLLLDEFYRTSVLIAGQIPIWWLVPPEEERHYTYFTETLLRKRFIQPDDSLDFGSVGEIPAGEYIGAGIWQLYKGIESPYKSVLKILLNEIYASEHPHVEPLSLSFKKSIYQGISTADDLDPYVMMYRRLETYLLQRNETDRLELIRRCFYFKIGLTLSKSSSNPANLWQRNVMLQLIKDWGWTQEHLINLDQRKQWKVARVSQEQKSLVRELTNSYHFLLDFARRTNTTTLIDSHEMTILGRKLYAAFERRAGKIEWINPGISDAISENHLIFSHKTHHDESTWMVHTDLVDARQVDVTAALKKSRDLISLMTWCHYNGLMNESTKLSLIPGKHTIAEHELHVAARSIRQLFPINHLRHPTDSLTRFAKPAHPQLILLLINVGADPLSNMRAKGIERLSEKTDSFGFSGLRENLIVNIEKIVLNNWGEMTTQSYHGSHAILDCIRDYLIQLPPQHHHHLPKLEIRCFNQTRAQAITQRIDELFQDICTTFYSGNHPASSRFVMEFENGFQILQWINNEPGFHTAASYAELLNYLGRPQVTYSPIILDRHCLKQSTLASLFPHQQRDCIQIFFRPNQDIAEIFVLDELGSLYRFQSVYRDVKTLLYPLEQFLCSLLFRRNGEIPDTLLGEHKHTVAFEYYEVSTKGILSISPHWRDSVEHRFFPVQAIGEPNNGTIDFTLYCDQQEFSTWDHGQHIFDAAAKFILSRRRNHERYPCYITDLDLSRCKAHLNQSVVHFHYKQWLEKRLNEALLTIE